MNKAIGGYFELEISGAGGRHYHSGAVRLNSARCAFEYTIRARGYRKVYLPYYTCDVMLEPIKKLGIDYEFYRIDEKLEPVFNKKLGAHEAFLYTNYYGVKQAAVEKLAGRFSERLIVDNAQAFYAPALKGVDTFYSARKFFGVADGAYLYTDKLLEEEYEQDISHQRMSHLLKRLELGAEAGYADFCDNDGALVGEPIKTMSKITDAILRSIDYTAARKIRNTNFEHLHEQLKSSNKFTFDNMASIDPMVYPYWSESSGLRNKLIEDKIFVARYWPNIEKWANDGLEVELMNNLIPLPVDQRYSTLDMDRIIKIIEDHGV